MKCKKGSKLRLAVNMQGHVLTLNMTPANTDTRVEVGYLAQVVRISNGQEAADTAKAHDIELEMVTLPGAKRGFGLLSRRLVKSGSVPGPSASTNQWEAMKATPQPSSIVTSSPSPASYANRPCK